MSTPTLFPMATQALGLLLVVVGVAALLILLRTRNAPRPRQVTQSRAEAARSSYPPTSNRGTLPYALIPEVLTSAEQTFFAALQAAVPAGLIICPQVRLANLVNVTSRGRQQRYDFYRIQAKCVDFVLCDALTTAPRLVIELDDSSHQRADRQARDAFVDAVLASVGLPILHVRWAARYDQAVLVNAIQHQLDQQKLVQLPTDPGSASTASNGTVRWACRHCQTEVSATAKFCHTCGQILELC